MVPDLFRLVAAHGIEEVYPVLLVALLRPLGLLFGFTAFNWAFGTGRTLRISVAVALGLPTLAVTVHELEPLIADVTIAQIALLTPKELGIGFLLGFLASLPFFALRYAGTIVATYKGEADGGFGDPVDGTMESVAVLFQLIGLAAFAYGGGLWLTTANLYQSYGIWPLYSVFPRLNADAVGTLFSILIDTMLIAIRTAVPLLAILVFVDFTLAVAARIGRRFRLFDYSFLAKNLITLLLLPVFAYLVWLTAQDIDLAAAQSLPLLRELFE
ncbi:MAG: flagellar biosynthetic protein FliR [Pseudomonadota bacterium]